MGKRSPGRDLKKVDPPAGVPDYLAKEIEGDDTLDELQQYKILPRFKVVQATADSELLTVFDPGDVILSPGAALVSHVNKKERASEPFLFVPILFFAEFCKWADLKDKESPTIMARTFDPSSDLAKRSRNPDMRIEEYGSGFKARYVEHLNFPGYIYGEHPLKGECAVLCFSRGEFGKGRAFISGVTMRKTPLWSQVWQFKTGFRERGADRKWWGIDYSTPEEYEPFIDEGEVEFFKSAHEELKELYDKQKLIVDHDDSKDEAADDSGEF